MNIRDGIIEAADALGMSPMVLATIISFETGGTFDPTAAGPTTQWGQHRGLIQFGEPQAKDYGVDWNDPIGSQLGANGAIVKYFTRNGWKPGMSMLDAYSIVNAGAPGRYTASDAANGGTHGDVRNKVETQMGAHRDNASRLMGQGDGAYSYASSVPTPSQGQQVTTKPGQPAQQPTSRPQAPMIDPLAVYAQQVSQAPVMPRLQAQPLTQFAHPSKSIENQFAQLLGAAKGNQPYAR
jgi:hypothetical protein